MYNIGTIFPQTDDIEQTEIDMRLAIFDLDNTLLAGDSDYSWGCFLAKQGVLDAQHYQETNDQYYRQYQNGNLDIHAFLRFALEPLKNHSIAALQSWRLAFMQEVIEPMVLPKAQSLVEQHRRQGHTLMIITATNYFITEPIAARYGIEHLLATEPEVQGGRYTGEIQGIPSYREGKVLRLQEWLNTHNIHLEESWFYSDSYNDIPLLETVDHPVAVDADAKLVQHAMIKNWPHISLR